MMNKLLSASALGVVISVGLPGNAMAAPNPDATCRDGDGVRSLQCGEDADASDDYSTAIGVESEATGYSSTAVGALAEASGSHSTALGEADWNPPPSAPCLRQTKTRQPLSDTLQPRQQMTRRLSGLTHRRLQRTQRLSVKGRWPPPSIQQPWARRRKHRDLIRPPSALIPMLPANTRPLLVTTPPLRISHRRLSATMQPLPGNTPWPSAMRLKQPPTTQYEKAARERTGGL